MFREGTSHVSPDGALRVITSVDGETPSTGLVGTSKASFTEWKWKDLGIKMGGPHMIRLPDGRYVAAVRLDDGKVRTSLCWLDLIAGELTEFLTLPSAGDNSPDAVNLFSPKTMLSTRDAVSLKRAVFDYHIRIVVLFDFPLR